MDATYSGTKLGARNREVAKFGCQNGQNVEPPSEIRKVCISETEAKPSLKHAKYNLLFMPIWERYHVGSRNKNSIKLGRGGNTPVPCIHIHDQGFLKLYPNKDSPFCGGKCLNINLAPDFQPTLIPKQNFI